MEGKIIRLKQLFKHSGRILLLPMDHGITLGPIEGIRDITATLSQVKDKVDAVVVHKGMVAQVTDFLGKDGCELIVHLAASTSLSPEPDRKQWVTSVKHAIMLGATAVSVHVNLGSEFEAEMLRYMGKTAEECERWGIPLLAMMYYRSKDKTGEYSPDKIMHAARVAEELGADIVKVNYTGSVDTFSDVVKGVKIPVVIAGGPKVETDQDLISMISGAIQAGAKGVAIGRNVFQHKEAGKIVEKIRTILDN